MLEKIKKDMIQALKDKDKNRLAILRILISTIETERSRIGLKGDFSKEQIVGLINRNLKVLKQEIDSLIKADRDTSAQEEQREVLLSYLPKQLTEKEIIEEVRHAINLVERKEYDNPMQYLSVKLKGKADMGLVFKIAKKYQNKL